MQNLEKTLEMRFIMKRMTMVVILEVVVVVVMIMIPPILLKMSYLLREKEAV